MPNKTRAISHIGILVHDADAATRLWTEAFGFQKFNDLSIEVEGIRSVFLSPGGTAEEMTIEIMEPLDKSDMENALSRRLATVGEGFYHLCLEVDDVAASGRALEQRGMNRHPQAGRGQSGRRRSGRGKRRAAVLADQAAARRPGTLDRQRRTDQHPGSVPLTGASPPLPWGTPAFDIHPFDH